MTQMRYTTRQDAIEQAIAPALSFDAGHYDMEAICAETFEWGIDYDERGNGLAATGGFHQVVTGEAFWDIVVKHERGMTG